MPAGVAIELGGAANANGLFTTVAVVVGTVVDAVKAVTAGVAAAVVPDAAAGVTVAAVGVGPKLLWNGEDALMVPSGLGEVTLLVLLELGFAR
ncbi:hypothetical protein BCR41DRAFT_358830 [Lobosporangium transversale]|uniref:Uncharacterized protein n=1 Tax=Lobosporangium transversale TaxID=64571 RepID=A0A1Y2GGP2_9FUNG|nr:hypothetical protein BCR41DRAFT_358830 [Lobosporangium transversale]ORZ09070.1 hypothetical protein BCR41DRAFT_358830 [Lobosporangium transversale]|eukprot:XP_021878697.1 hypothetical protein BCR41DRAFT_358830 [Lobosporangium transversale]